MKLNCGQKLLFIGDSITDSDRAKPKGEGLFGALGKGYVSFVNALLTSGYPKLQIRVINKGVSGNTVRDLAARWEEDVLNERPDWLVIMIGINDVWRQFDTPFIPEWHVYEKEYMETLEKLVIKTKPNVKQIVLMTPFYIESNEQDPMRKKMDNYGAIVKNISKANDCMLVDTQAAFNNILKDLYPAALAWDRVHPDPTGHIVLAKAFLKEIGFDWNH